jgi:hypothetical protein
VLRPARDQIMDLKHPLMLLGDRIDWDFLDNRLSHGVRSRFSHGVRIRTWPAGPADPSKRGHVDESHRGYNHPHRFRIWIPDRVRCTTAVIKREVKRRTARDRSSPC